MTAPEASVVALEVAASVRRAARRRRLGADVFCRDCGERDEFALQRAFGRTLCLRCTAEVAPRPRHLRPPAERYCLACGFVSREGLSMEAHHLLGRAHHPTLVLPLCRNCHALVSERQRHWGVNLRPLPSPAARVPQAVGSALALALVMLDRHPSESRWPALLAYGLLAALGVREVQRDAVR